MAESLEKEVDPNALGFFDGVKIYVSYYPDVFFHELVHMFLAYKPELLEEFYEKLMTNPPRGIKKEEIKEIEMRFAMLYDKEILKEEVIAEALSRYLIRRTKEIILKELANQ